MKGGQPTSYRFYYVLGCTKLWGEGVKGEKWIGLLLGFITYMLDDQKRICKCLCLCLLGDYPLWLGPSYSSCSSPSLHFIDVSNLLYFIL
jgi:hypothetical protein